MGVNRAHMIRSVLVANRGEIAVRVFRTARRMGLRTIAVYSDADEKALHVAAADEARRIGPAPAHESYLNADAIIAAAKDAGAEAIHPGYGFLSENAEFAAAVEKAGLVFIGPPPSAIRAMGSKSEAKALMEKAQVPVVPGYHGEKQDDATFAKEAKRIGFPVLVKASVGGGGRGMRIVREARELAAALEGARREAQSAFGDGRLLIEKYLTRPRHIELQVFGDSHGNVIHLLERECSIQRRHQKVIEEAPSPFLDEKTRRAMGEAAVAAARAIAYRGAGTVEFIVDESGAFYFMEMNTRLQVEHPVTEMVTWLDLVEWQIRVASGEALPLRQEQVAPKGHAIEARLYAEDPGRGFLPSTGMLAHLRFPETGKDVRVDSGVRAGDAISIHYDPMIAKLVVWGPDRAAAVARLGRALAACQIVGVANNVDFLSAIAAHPAFDAGETDTGFIARHEAALLPAAKPASDRVLALACLSILLERQHRAAEEAARSGDPHSPWCSMTGWRANDAGRSVLRFHDGGAARAVTVTYGKDFWTLGLPEGAVRAKATAGKDGEVAADLGGARVTGAVIRTGDALVIFADSRSHRLAIDDPLAIAAKAEEASGHLTAPMPGKILKVLVEEGQEVARGAPLVVMEAMKMEHTIAAPADGCVAKIAFRAGDQVSEGAELLVLEKGKAA
jgi:3-methylcrotonyl-CoA carboxylase alpha subunit